MFFLSFAFHYVFLCIAYDRLHRLLASIQITIQLTQCVEKNSSPVSFICWFRYFFFYKLCDFDKLYLYANCVYFHRKKNKLNNKTHRLEMTQQLGDWNQYANKQIHLKWVYKLNRKSQVKYDWCVKIAWCQMWSLKR